MKQQINEELNVIKYLFDYKKGKVVSEQHTSLITEETELQKNAKACGWTFFSSESAITIADTQGYEKSGWECPKGSGKRPEKTPVKTEKEVVVKVSPQTNDATNIQKKLVELGQDIGPKGVDGRIGPDTMKAVWSVIKDIQK
jgi:hypothetical protein